MSRGRKSLEARARDLERILREGPKPGKAAERSSDALDRFPPLPSQIAWSAPHVEWRSATAHSAEHR